jgi:hypothetical protein
MSAGDGVGFEDDPAKVREWKRHPEYKDSGVRGLWRCRALGYRTFKILQIRIMVSAADYAV